MDKIQTFYFFCFCHLHILICSLEAQGFPACCICDKYHADTKGCCGKLVLDALCLVVVWPMLFSLIFADV